jgi:hypothetical protein
MGGAAMNYSGVSTSYSRAVERFGPIDMRAQAEVPSARKADTPR